MAPDLNDEVFAPTGCTSAVQGRTQCTGEQKAFVRGSCVAEPPTYTVLSPHIRIYAIVNDISVIIGTAKQ
ncbi:hypothetical protein VTO73DRAFT_12738 [Trametes versicolor]